MTRYRHKKSGGEYELMAYGTFVSIDPARDLSAVYVAEIVPGIWHVRHAFWYGVTSIQVLTQCKEYIRTGDVVAIYQSVLDSRIWVRPLTEFLDGRFERAVPFEELEKAVWGEPREVDPIMRAIDLG